MWMQIASRTARNVQSVGSTPQALLSQIQATTSLTASCLARQGLERNVCNKRIVFEEHVRTPPPQMNPFKNIQHMYVGKAF